MINKRDREAEKKERKLAGRAASYSRPGTVRERPGVSCACSNRLGAVVGAETDHWGPKSCPSMSAVISWAAYPQNHEGETKKYGIRELNARVKNLV